MKVNAEKISQAPNKFYGKEVAGYTAPHAGVDKWRIFYSDGTNIYLIADDYIAGENAPNGKDGSAITIHSTYELSMENLENDYTSSSDIKSSKGSKWLSQFMSKYPSSTNNNIKAVAYMMDTNVWSAYYAGEDAEYAMGGPTLEMFCASYKDTHPSKYPECSATNSYGYSVKWNTASSYNTYIAELPQDELDSIYIKSDTSKVTRGMWIASPSAYDSITLMGAAYDGIVASYYYNRGNLGFRPLVCLKSNVQLEMQDNATLAVVK